MVAYVEACARCGWKFPTFHICLDRPLHIMRRVEELGPKLKRSHHKRDPRSDAYKGTDAWRSNISEGMQEYLARNRETHRERDADIIRRYSVDECTFRELAVEFKLSVETISHVLHRAQDEGDVVIRPPARRIGRW